MDLPHLLDAALALGPERIAVHAGERRCTYRELEDQSSRLAGSLRELGLRPGDRLALLLANTPEYVVACLAAFKAELIVVPVTRQYSPPQINYVLRHSGSRALITEPSRLEMIEALPDRQQIEHVILVGTDDENSFQSLLEGERLDSPPAGDRLALLIYTSGTTSRPKGVIHSSRRLADRIELFHHEAGITADDVTFVALVATRPMVLTAQVLSTLAAGGTLVLLEQYSPANFWREYCLPPAKTFVAAAPGVVADLFAHPDHEGADHSALRLWIAGGDRVNPAVHDLFHRATGRHLTEMCGMTESGFYAMNPATGPIKLGSIGFAMRDVLVRLVDDRDQDVPPGETGNILLRTPDMMVGYWNDTLETFRAFHNGWLRTGDLAKSDDEGYLWFVGRAKDMIARDGWKIAPAMLESVLQEHADVAVAVIVGVSEPPHGESIHAYFRPRAERIPSTEELRSWMAARVEPVAMPVTFTALKELPMTPAGKVDRERLRWMAAAGVTEI